ncbi:hypothetical protein [Methylobacterium sp. J-070]|uniref:hypothetical protein n=1 Tax=Methylobacterium sp. J-070 TaxID=2836650 RepID=UPI001FBABDBA|nr:hypothetical protein [Methylobacterium sp. J-070]MCJ2053272.1 hypothetical protein [Methylobacterium sp. J-070]
MISSSFLIIFCKYDDGIFWIFISDLEAILAAMNAVVSINGRSGSELFSLTKDLRRDRSAVSVAGPQQRRLSRARGGCRTAGSPVDTTPAIANTSRPPPRCGGSREDL